MRLLRWILLAALLAASAAAGVAALLLYNEYWAKLPALDALLDYRPPVATRVYASDGALVEEFFVEKRYFTPIDKIPVGVRNAFVAAEDSDFYSHFGFDLLGVVRAFVANLRAGDVVQGGSTITQQVVKSLLLSPERSYERKLREVLLAIKLERELSKERILELYLNQIYFGDGNYGIAAASRSYFDKQPDQLSIAQAALLAGLPQAPSRYSPTRHPDAANARKRYVLRRMMEEGFITSGSYREALREDPRISEGKDSGVGVRSYYTEAVRLTLEKIFGKEAPYDKGYRVYTGMSLELQHYAEQAVKRGVERVDWLLGYRGPSAHLEPAEAGARIAADRDNPALAELADDRLYQAVVTEAGEKNIKVAVGNHDAEIKVSGLLWRTRKRGFSAGDLVEVRTSEAGSEPAAPEPGKKPRLWLAQSPQIEAALVAIDLKTGYLAATVGGYDFAKTQFNRATQARRQPGSAFKPFVYSAALDNGFTPASIIYDEPVKYLDHGRVWEPKNYSRQFYGPTTVRTALEHSRNVVTIKMVDSIGVDRVVDYIHAFGFDAEIGRNLSIGLGTSELTLLDLASAYTTFANGGVKITPVTVLRVQDPDGKVVYAARPQYRQAISPQTAALVTQMLQGVVQNGTGRSVRSINRPVAGKTGTTNDQKDAWFIGYTPELVVGVWVGYDDHARSMGRPGTGGRVAAPIWLDFMTHALADAPVSDFNIPEGIRCVNIDAKTGLRANAYTADPYLECFKDGTEPPEYQSLWIWGGTPAGSDAGGDSRPDTNPDAPGFVPFPSAPKQPAAPEREHDDGFRIFPSVP